MFYPDTMPSNYSISDYSLRDADYYMERISESIVEKLSAEEHKNLKEVISSALPKPSPKLIDLRFVINLIFARYFFVLLIGKDRYKKRIMNQDSPISYRTNPLKKLAHRLVSVLLFLAMNLLVSVFVLAFIYLVAKLFGFHLLGGNLNAYLRC